MRVLMILLLPLALWAGEFMKQGNEFYRNGEFAKALPFYRKALYAEENPPITHFNIANCYFQLDSLPQAMVHYKTTIEQAPEFFRAYLNLGIIYFNQELYGDAVAVLERARIEDPTNKTTIYVLSAAYRELKRYDHAVPLLQQAIDLDSNRIDTYFMLAEISRELEDPAEAEVWLKKYPDTGKRRADKYYMLAEIAEEQDRIGEAIYYLNQFTALDTTDQWPHYKIVQLMQKQGNPLSAIYKVQETLKRFSGFSDIALLGGNIAFTEKQYDLAEELYLTAYKNGHAGGVVGLSNLNKHYRRVSDEESIERIAQYLSKS